MRQIGTVKWFPGYSSKIGYINDYMIVVALDVKTDMYVKLEEVRCSEASLKEGVFVTFEVGINPRTGLKEVRNLRLLAEETNPETMSEAVSLIGEEMRTLSSRQKEELVRSLPKNILLASRLAREGLPIDVHIDLCLEMLSTEQPRKRTRDMLLAELCACLEQSGESIWELVPDAIVLEDRVWPIASLNRRIDILAAQLGEEGRPGNEDIISQIARVLVKASHEEIPSLLSRLPDWTKRHEAISDFLPHIDQVAILAAQLGEEGRLGNEDIISRIAQVLVRASREEIPSLLSRLPDWTKQHEAIFDFLPSVDQVNSVWFSPGVGLLSVWQRLSRKAKILCAYRAAKEDKILPVLEGLEDDLLVRCVVVLLWARDNPQKSDATFREAHRLLQQYVVDQAWSSTELLDLCPLLPRCHFKVVQYCEGRPWPTEEDKKTGSDRASCAFCPRLNGPCALFRPNVGIDGARVYAECSQPWEDWSLLELLEATGVVPCLSELSSPDEYVPKVSGWVNRLNEIRKRLKCSVCGQIMIPNYQYARNLAVYNSTVASCQHGGSHDQNVYLSHCWACREIIDSRESTVRVEGYYICIHCGSGPKHSLSYTQGNICPQCGTREMGVNPDDERIRICRSCSHSVRLPPDWKLTGSRSERARNSAGAF